MVSKHIVITGFMGAGKTTVAKALGRLLDRDVVDLDEAITKRERRSPQQIIEEDGESVFRDVETRILREILKVNPMAVLALGGGTWTIPGNRQALSEHGSRSVWLDVPFELCWERIKASEQARPLAISHEAAKRRYQERKGVYGLADFRVEGREEKSPAEIAVLIAALLSRKLENI